MIEQLHQRPAASDLVSELHDVLLHCGIADTAEYVDSVIRRGNAYVLSAALLWRYLAESPSDGTFYDPVMARALGPAGRRERPWLRWRAGGEIPAGVL